ncbi:DUF3304 domain-containing protein [Lysobacter auxotrophicus]|uniref:DUF3304 domain-containing protein n=1 Tax=Lysobacter auxotrophicus TaxID=2992573 RepID=A0ABM8D9B0_9GAMM|nr:DUF3304 domain-containing protein [Lysobacter auxotrophicus]BDU15129.1 hypothetical protein LA521A_03300 [Lysobacter auxotrophicus]
MLSIRAVAIGVALLVLGACKADTYTSADLASHEAFLKAAAVCEKIKNANEREACWAEAPVDWTDTDPNEITGVSLTGIDHLADHLSVQEFSVDGASGAQAGKGGRITCCAKLPNRWRPGLTVEVRWNVTNWRDCTGEEHVRRVPVEPYELADHMYVHFLAGGNVKVVSSFWHPGGANLPSSKYPIKDPIPDKHPWAQYPFETTCKHKMRAKERR